MFSPETIKDLNETVKRVGESISIFAAKEAEKLSLSFIGEINADTNAAYLNFPYDEKLKIKWSEVDDQLRKIGKPISLFSDPKGWHLGIRGTKGDIRMRIIDIKQHRFEGVSDYILNETFDE